MVKSNRDPLATTEATRNLHALGNSFLYTRRKTLLWLADQNKSLAIKLLSRDDDLRSSAINPNPPAFSDTPELDGLTEASLLLASVDRDFITDQMIDKRGSSSYLIAPKSETSKRARQALERIKNNWEAYSPEKHEKHLHVLENIASGSKSLSENDLDWALSKIENGLKQLRPQPQSLLWLQKGAATRQNGPDARRGDAAVTRVTARNRNAAAGPLWRVEAPFWSP